MPAAETLCVDPLVEPVAALCRGTGVVLLASQPVMMAPARGISAETINLMAREARGLICHAMTAARMLEIGLPLIPSTGRMPGAWRYAVSYEAGTGCTTGISAEDRARTLNAGAGASVAPGDIATPGHIIPVLGDPDAPAACAHAPSAALRMLRRAGIPGGAAICTILDADGGVADSATATALAARLALWAVPVEALGATDTAAARLAEARPPVFS